MLIYRFKNLLLDFVIRKKEDGIMDNKLGTITNLFENSEIRSVWDSEKE